MEGEEDLRYTAQGELGKNEHLAKKGQEIKRGDFNK